MKQIEEKKVKETQLAQKLEKKEEEMMKFQDKYLSQKDEIEDKTKRIKALF
jgi:hypothetical protein